MAGHLRHPQGTPEKRWPRRWVSYERYRIVHENRIEALIREGVVVRDDTRFSETRKAETATDAFLSGEIETASGGVLHVFKRLVMRTRRGRTQVLTALYIYHALVRRDGEVVDLVRYDNSHGDTGTLHRHVFDGAGRALGEEPIALEELPPLSGVVREVEARARRLRERDAGA